ncbi:Hypothetical protein CINCED_3A004394 [Cinara cedri]|uniref:Uncharacterized protein n=1 Tax=Cinara cedri TaxID=506608 RepID=A0A5E4MKT6_9HEMI|nr:Hypothetical protein CINCED_3A004394 [Cinara cedri]
MSSDRKNEIPSNEEVIEELTKNLKDSAIKTDSFGNDETHSFSESDTEADSHSKDETEIRDVDYIEDDLLKERDENLSEEEKRELLQKALSLKNEGNTKFKNQEHEEASKIYTEALRICPLMFPNYRAILFSNRAAAKSTIHIESAIQDCTRAIELDPVYLKAYIRRSKLFERNDKLDEALEDLKKVLEIDRNYTEAAYNARVCYF